MMMHVLFRQLSDNSTLSVSSFSENNAARVTDIARHALHVELAALQGRI